jgi:phenylalanyl-tRNA synthetase beta chain
MKLSLRWIQEFVDVEGYLSKPEELAEILTRAGFEVEAIHDNGKQFAHVVVGHILEKDRHPNADKLSLCRVSTGQNQVNQIICGAQNHKTGDRVVVALPGALLPGNFAIKKSTIRGVESSGMLCSFKELGLAGDSDGIIILPSDTPVGISLAAHWGLDDVIFELKVTPNRADGLSHYGLAREIAALLKKEIKVPNSEMSGTKSSQSGKIKVKVKAPDLAPRYMGRLIEGVKVGMSPDWLRRKIESVGLKSINNIVDVTNYILIELGQPLHAFDANKISDGSLVVDRAGDQEKFKTLDGTELTLKNENLTIRDSKQALCLAGVIGGLNSGTNVDTQNIFLEAACFAAQSIRKSARTFGIETDASYRFARGIDSSFTDIALAKACDMIIKVAGGKVAADYVDIDNRVAFNPRIKISAQLISDRLGYPATLENIKEFALRLHLKIENEDNGFVTLIPPSFRQDLIHEMDFVEEYARLNGYENIPETLPKFSEAPTQHDSKYLFLRNVAQSFSGLGFSQALNYAFCSQQKEKAFLGIETVLKNAGLNISSERITLLNPLNEELNVMRSSLVYGLYQNVLHNYRHGQEQGQIFETGSCFSKSDSVMNESTRMAGFAWGQSEDLWGKQNQESPVFKLKGAIEVWAKKNQLNSLQFKTNSELQAPEFIHRGQWAMVELEGKAIGYIGVLHPKLLDDNKIRVPVAAFEIELDRLLNRGMTKFKSITPSKFPAVERDLAFVMPDTLAVGEVLKVIRQQSGELLVDLKVIDVFEGEPLEKGQKSVALRLVLQDRENTLQEDRVNALQQKLIEALKSRYPIALR